MTWIFALKLHKRLHNRPAGRRRFGMTLSSAAIAVLTAGLLLGGCDSRENPLAPYAGDRELQILRVTQSFTSDVQWVGGRVAAVGVNRGTAAALDSTLIWIQRGSGNTVSSHVTIDDSNDRSAVENYGGLPVDQLEDGGTYTFWLATEEAYAGALGAGVRNGFTFADTTLTMNLVLNGLARGGADVTMRVVMDERLTGTEFRVEWTPADHAFRRAAIRRGAALPGFTDLIWHVVLPDDEPDSITSPLIIGSQPDGALTALEWTEGFQPAVHTLWLVDSTWDNTFGVRARGMAAFVMFATNF
jgi:hypothetical protein